MVDHCVPLCFHKYSSYIFFRTRIIIFEEQLYLALQSTKISLDKRITQLIHRKVNLQKKKKKNWVEGRIWKAVNPELQNSQLFVTLMERNFRGFKEIYLKAVLN